MGEITRKEEDMIKKFVKKRMENLDLAHNFEHIRCTVNLAKKNWKN